MLRISEIKLPLGHPPEALKAAVLERLGVPEGRLEDFTIARRGHDARRRGRILRVYSVDAAVRGEDEVLAAGRPGVAPRPDETYRPPAGPLPAGARPPVVIGAGPCGLMAALILAEAGLRPVILERGRVVRERTKDTWGLWRRGVLDPGSNVQFGEGGAGTFSDGKLYSQIRDPRRLGRKVLREFVEAGAPPEILVEAHPHVGTFRLVAMVERIRAKIEALGGAYRFETEVVDLEIDAREGRRRLAALHLAGGERLPVDAAVLAPGHSARPLFETLLAQGVALEQKPFSVGVRIEHPQSWIDRALYGPCAGHPDLGAAAYGLAHHAATGRTAYSFCMCPGGTVVAAASEPGGVVTNGMSQYSRNERNANAGFVVEVSPADFPDAGVLGGVRLQRALEARAFALAGGGYRAPAQRAADFLAGRPSEAVGAVLPSYRPGVTPTDLAGCLPPEIVATLREALPAFGRKIPGFDAPDALLTGVETRTSSPVRIPRGADFQSRNTQGLYPAGEGAGYAGGILSAAVDGIRTAEAVAAAYVARAVAA